MWDFLGLALLSLLRFLGLANDALRGSALALDGIAAAGLSLSTALP